MRIRFGAGPLALGAALVAILLGTTPAQADCRCSTSTRAPWCTTQGQPIQYTSVRGTQFSVSLGAYGGSNQYVCGQYADQTIWVVGNNNAGSRGVVVQSMTPAPGSSQNGWEVNPRFDQNSIDGRGNGNTRGVYSSPPALPAAFSGSQLPASFVKGVSRPAAVAANGTCEKGGEDNRSCFQYIDVITFVSAVPDSDGDSSTADEFRPAFHGASNSKPGPYRTDMMSSALGSWPSYSPGSIAGEPDLAACERSQRHPILEFQQLNFSDSDVPMDSAAGPYGTKSYQGGFALNSTACMLRTLLSDAAVSQETPTRSVGRQLLINIVQRGIDMYGAYRTGRRWRFLTGGGWGGHWHGQKPYATVAAHLLRESGLMSFARSEAGPTFWEDGQANRGSDGRMYYGYTQGGPCTSGFTDNTASADKGVKVYCAPKTPAGPWDSNCLDIQGQAYPLQHINISTGMATLVHALRAESTWNDATYMEWAYAVGKGPRGPGHQGGKPYKLYCGTSNKNGMTNWPQDPGYNGYYRCAFCEEMFDAFSGAAPVNQPPPPAEPPPPEPLPAPVQLD